MTKKRNSYTQPKVRQFTPQTLPCTIISLIALDPVGDSSEYTDSLSYPGVSASPSVVSPHLQSAQPEPPTPCAPAQISVTPSPSPAQLEAIYAAASSGDLVQLRRLFRTAAEEQHADAFALANEATSRTGLTPLHAACSRGHLDIAQWCKN